MSTIMSGSRGPINAADPDAVRKLKVKLKKLQKMQETMKAVNAYYRKHKTLDGCPFLTQGDIDKLTFDMAASWRVSDTPFFSFQLSNNSAAIRSVKARIEQLTLQRASSCCVRPASGEKPSEPQHKAREG